MKIAYRYRCVYVALEQPKITKTSLIQSRPALYRQTRHATGFPFLVYCLLYRQREDIGTLGQKLQMESDRIGIITLASDISNTKQQTRSASAFQRRRSVVGKIETLTYLVHQFEDFQPTRWYMGVCLLLLRLVQTSFMTVIDGQLVQAAIMCIITLIAAFLQKELSPYRRHSDNIVALLAHWLVFGYVSVLAPPHCRSRL